MHGSPTQKKDVRMQVEEGTLDITELPVRKWTQDYKEFLEGMIKPEAPGQPPLLVDYREHHSGANVHFSLQLSEGRLTELLSGDLTAKFKLSTKVSTGVVDVHGTSSCMMC